jgi:rhodanese-related sulfurtransferase
MENISVSDVRSRLEAGEKINLVDVREPSENEDFNIGGTLLPLGKIIGMELESIENLKNEEVVLYCRSGNRSMQACMYLEMNGFTNVKNLVGGMNEWRTA